MKIIISLLLTLLLILTPASQTSAQSRKPKTTPARLMETGKKLLEAKKFEPAALHFYNLLYGKNQLQGVDRNTAKFYLGLALSRLQLHQMASFAFLSVTEGPDKKLAQKAFTQLAKSARFLDDRSLLYYSLKKMPVDDLSEIGQEYFLNSLAHLYLEQNKLDEAAKSLDEALKINPENIESLYLRGLTYIKSQNDTQARSYFETLYKKFHKSTARRTMKQDEATVALARVNYNLRNWSQSIELYREIPKDSHLFRQVTKELAWAHFRNGQFRSSLSVLQSLNTPYYENFYDPESWVLRSIILLFICQPNELEKSVQFFNKYYITAYNSLKLWNQRNYKDEKHFAIVADLVKALDKNKDLTSLSKELPFFFFRTLLEDPEISQKFSYLNQLKKEKKTLNSEFNSPSQKRFNNFGNKIINSRMKTVSLQIGQLVKKQLQNLEVELSDYVTQFEFINYEYLELKKRAAKKAVFSPEEKEPEIRKVMIESGFQYYPFDGEYWRDEIGNYQYIGRNQCGSEYYEE